MNFNQLRYFVAIVKHGSFWSAALEEYISQSSLSKQIKALETELGSLKAILNSKAVLTYWKDITNSLH